MQLTPELVVRSLIFPHLSFNDAEALEQTPALQARVTIRLALKDFPSCRSYKPGGLCAHGQGNIDGRFLDIHGKEEHQKRLYRLATARLIHYSGYLCA